MKTTEFTMPEITISYKDNVKASERMKILSSKTCTTFKAKDLHNFWYTFCLLTKIQNHHDNIMTNLVMILTIIPQQPQIPITSLAKNHNSSLINLVFRQWSIIQRTGFPNLLKSSSPSFNHTTFEKDVSQFRIIRL